MPNKIIEIKDLYAGYDQNQVLENINMDIYSDDFIGIIGPNGGGKTTFVKNILKLLKPFSGSVSHLNLNNEPLKIGYLPQLSNLDQKFPISVADVVLSGLMSKKSITSKYNRTEKDLAETLLTNFGILNLAKKNIGELSGGQRQRVLLARSIIAKPHLLILDEPNTFVDNLFEEELYEILSELNKEIAIILVTHDVGTIFSYVKTIACINRSLHYHPTNEVTNDMLKAYNCPIDLVTHGTVPHRVLKEHNHGNH